MVCGDLTVWKGAPSTNLVTIAVAKIIIDVLDKNGFNGVFTFVTGGIDIGEKLVADHRLKLVSFTGSTKVGRAISSIIANRFGKSILELGGNNACLIMEDGDLDMALPSVVFSAVGTCGQRCTSLRRLIVHEAVYDTFLAKLMKVYPTISIGDPFESSTLCGPLHSKVSMKIYEDGIQEIIKQGGKVAYGGKKHDTLKEGNFVYPTIITDISYKADIVQNELFCPIMYIFKVKSFEEAVENNNSVPQGLSSGIFTKDMSKVFKWMGPLGSDCGLVNVNMSTSGAEIGGAFGGNKETGWGRESGGEAWKGYMRQTTCAINYGNSVALAQGIKFDI